MRTGLILLPLMLSGLLANVEGAGHVNVGDANSICALLQGENVIPVDQASSEEEAEPVSPLGTEWPFNLLLPAVAAAILLVTVLVLVVRHGHVSR